MLWNVGFVSLMEDNRMEDLRRMYTLFSRVKALEDLKMRWNVFIKVNCSFSPLIVFSFTYLSNFGLA